MTTPESPGLYDPVEFHGDEFRAGTTWSHLGGYATFAVMLSLPGAVAVKEMLTGEQPLAAAVLVALFAVPGAMFCDVFLRSLMRRSDALRIDENGVSHAIFGRVTWREVDGYHLHYRFRPRGSPLAELVLRLSPAARPVGRAFWRPTPRRGKPMRILLAGLDRSPQEILGAVAHLRKRHGPLEMPPASFPWPGVAEGELRQQTMELLSEMGSRAAALPFSAEWGQSDVDPGRMGEFTRQLDVDSARLKELMRRTSEAAAADCAGAAGRERPWRIGIYVFFALSAAAFLVLVFRRVVGI